MDCNLKNFPKKLDFISLRMKIKCCCWYHLNFQCHQEYHSRSHYLANMGRKLVQLQVATPLARNFIWVHALCSDQNPLMISGLGVLIPVSLCRSRHCPTPALPPLCSWFNLNGTPLACREKKLGLLSKARSSHPKICIIKWRILGGEFQKKEFWVRAVCLRCTELSLSLSFSLFQLLFCEKGLSKGSEILHGVSNI